MPDKMNSEELDKLVLADIRGMAAEEVKRAHSFTGRDRQVAEFEVMMRIVWRVAPDLVGAGEFDAATAFFGKERDAAVRDPLRWGGSDKGVMNGEVVKMAAGVTVDILVDHYKMSARAASKEVSKWFPEKSPNRMGWKTIQNWQAKGREGGREGRASGMKEMRKRLSATVKRRAPRKGDRAGAKSVLKESLLTRVSRTESIQEAAER